jgi:hypothetical protein
VTGSIWENDPAGAADAIIGNVPGTTPDVTFTTDTPLNFTSGSLYTIGEFLASGNGATILTGAGELGNTLENTIFDFKGDITVTTGEIFTVGHDDGMTLSFGGMTLINAPGSPSSNTTSMYTGPSGTFAFELVYGECCGAPAALSLSLPLDSAPEPGTSFLLGTALIALGAGLRRKLGS